MRTRSASVVGRTGKVSLSKKRNVPSTERSARAPILKPSRMPCFTQALVRHSPAALRSAERISPRVSAARNSANVARSASVKLGRAAPPPASASMRSRSDMAGVSKEPQLLEQLAQPGPGLLLHRHERQAVGLLEQALQRHRGLHGAGIRLDEVRLHERQQAVVQRPSLVPLPLQGELAEPRHQGKWDE